MNNEVKQISAFTWVCPVLLAPYTRFVKSLLIMPKRGRGRKKTKTHAGENESGQNALSTNEGLKVPKSLVIRRGKCDSEVGELVEDVRKIFLPYTAFQFQEDPKNRKLTLAKYAKELALPMGITHILAFSQNEDRLNLRLARTPEGPTMTFRVHRFSLAKHIKALQRRPIADSSRSMQQNPPIVVTNNFGDSTAPPHVKLMRITFQNMFPAINVATVKLTDCRRVVLFHLFEEEEIISEQKDGTSNKSKERKGDPKKTTRTKIVVHVRHFAIKAAPVGVNRKVRRLIQAKLPNLNKVDDIADYIAGTAAAGGGSVGDASDSEPEEGDQNIIQLPQKYSGRGNSKSQKSALKLVELGPRLSIELQKVEKGLAGGDVMYHAHIVKSPQEAEELKERKAREEFLKKQRRDQQEQNVERKRKSLEEKREAKRQRKETREREVMEKLTNRNELEEENSGVSDEDSESS